MDGLSSPLPLPTPHPVTPPITWEDVLATFKGITPGWYKTADLYPRYAEICRRAGREPGTQRALGSAIGSRSDIERRHAHNHYTVWHVTDALV